MKKHWRKILLFLAIFSLLSIAFPFIWARALPWWYRAEMQPAPAVETRAVAIVFGARVYPNGRLSSMLRDRVETAVQLYETGKVQKIIMSGDNQSLSYNEPDAMVAYAVARGVPLAAIQADYGGRRTYDTCYRARDVFQVPAAFLVTQAFHLPRALFTCEQLGLDVTGVIADQRTYSPRSLNWSTTREIPASLNALYDILRQRPAPVLGEPIPLEIGAKD